MDWSKSGRALRPAGRTAERNERNGRKKKQMPVGTAKTGNLSNLSAVLRIRAAAERHCIRIVFSMPLTLRHCTPIAISIERHPTRRITTGSIPF
jgi:hypothetical protein